MGIQFGLTNLQREGERETKLINTFECISRLLLPAHNSDCSQSFSNYNVRPSKCVRYLKRHSLSLRNKSPFGIDHCIHNSSNGNISFSSYFDSSASQSHIPPAPSRLCGDRVLFNYPLIIIIIKKIPDRCPTMPCRWHVS